ncbi:MAG: ribonuclease III [bacterium]
MTVSHWLKRIFALFFVPPSPLSTILGYRFRNPELLKRALTHRSRLAETGEPAYLSNENLELLGDAVIDLLVTEALYHQLSSSPEGTISKYKAFLVSGTALSQIAMKLGLGDYLILSDNESRNGGRSRQSILENTFEAIVGAIYLDGGLSAARQFLFRSLLKDLPSFIREHQDTNYKSSLLEWAQSHGYPQPIYRLIGANGPDHHKTFKVEVWLNGNCYGKGTGNSKKAAEQQAAQDALKKIFNPNPDPSMFHSSPDTITPPLSPKKA